MNLIIDLGNSFCKVAVYQNNQEIYFQKRPEWSPSWRDEIFLNFPEIKSAISSNTRAESFDFDLPAQVNEQSFSHQSPFPFALKYESPQSLGLDRLAVSVGAFIQAPQSNHLIIDLGTCITYDIIESGNYLGGAIAPGLNMRLKAMHQFTGRLPLLEAQAPTALLGQNTASCIQSGAYNGMLAELNGLIEEYSQQFNVDRVWLTGGDAKHFEKQVKSTIFAAPQLLMQGLNYILNQHVEKP